MRAHFGYLLGLAHALAQLSELAAAAKHSAPADHDDAIGDEDPDGTHSTGGEGPAVVGLDVEAEQVECRRVVPRGQCEAGGDPDGQQQEQPEGDHPKSLLLGDSGAPPNNTDSSRMAPDLSSGWFWLPHFGDWMHDGQPSRQPHSRIVSRVAVSQSRATRKPRSANPAPPGCPS